MGFTTHFRKPQMGGDPFLQGLAITSSKLVSLEAVGMMVLKLPTDPQVPQQRSQGFFEKALEPFKQKRMMRCRTKKPWWKMSVWNAIHFSDAPKEEKDVGR